uniref:Uncharacterized protein n=1 Tax=Arundo donax TaxID=35708 RepID=A0A0A9BUQ0_ARUDO
MWLFSWPVLVWKMLVAVRQLVLDSESSICGLEWNVSLIWEWTSGECSSKLSSWRTHDDNQVSNNCWN